MSKEITPINDPHGCEYKIQSMFRGRKVFSRNDLNCYQTRTESLLSVICSLCIKITLLQYSQQFMELSTGLAAQQSEPPSIKKFQLEYILTRIDFKTQHSIKC